MAAQEERPILLCAPATMEASDSVEKQLLGESLITECDICGIPTFTHPDTIERIVVSLPNVTPRILCVACGLPIIMQGQATPTVLPGQWEFVRDMEREYGE